MLFNRSYTYVLPMLDWWDKKRIDNQQLKGVFIGDVNHPELDNHIFLLYQYSGHRWYAAFEAALEDSKYFRGSYEVDKAHVMYVYEVPPDRQKDYNTYRDSKYSQLSEDYKQHIVNYHGVDRTRKAAAVMYKHEVMFKEWEERINTGLPTRQHIQISRDQEAADALHMEVEIYNERVHPQSKVDALGANKTFMVEEEKDGEGENT